MGNLPEIKSILSYLSINYGINIRGKKANNTQTYTMTYKKNQ